MTPDAYDKNCILLAYAFDGKGGGTPLTGDSIAQKLEDDTLAWVHLRADHPETRDWLQQHVHYLDAIILDALLADSTRPRMLQHGDGALLILRGINLNENADPEDMVSIRLWIDAKRIVSLRRRRLKAIGEVEEQLQHHRGPRDAGGFLTELCGHLFERMEPVLTELEERTDAVEEQVMDSPDATLRREINDIRRQAITLRRYILPQREVLAALRNNDLSWLSSAHKRQFQEYLDLVLRYIDDLDAIRERAQIVKDELTNALADRLNRNTYLLSVIAAIFLPLSFLTGLLGINVGGIPGEETPTAFWTFSAMLAVLVTIQVVLFKKLRWF